MTEVCIVGWAHSPFGNLDDPDAARLTGRIACAAIADAGVRAADIDCGFAGNFDSGFRKGVFLRSMPIQSVGEAEDMQLPRADVGGVPKMGGAAVANSMSILERQR